MVSIAIIEDNSKLRRDLEEVLTAEGECTVVGSFRSAEEAWEKLPLAIPEVVIMDLNLPGASGAECTARLKARYPQIQVLMFTVYEDTEAIFGALRAGACGYLLKRAHPDQLLAAVHDARAGGAPMSSEIARKVVESFQKPFNSKLEPDDGLSSLTQRERETLDLLSKGLAPKEIASKLDISVNTIRVHLKRIYEKLHVRSQTEAVLRWVRDSPS